MWPEVGHREREILDQSFTGLCGDFIYFSREEGKEESYLGREEGCMFKLLRKILFISFKDLNLNLIQIFSKCYYIILLKVYNSEAIKYIYTEILIPKSSNKI